MTGLELISAGRGGGWGLGVVGTGGARKLEGHIALVLKTP